MIDQDKLAQVLAVALRLHLDEVSGKFQSPRAIAEACGEDEKGGDVLDYLVELERVKLMTTKSKGAVYAPSRRVLIELIVDPKKGDVYAKSAAQEDHEQWHGEHMSDFLPEE